MTEKAVEIDEARFAELVKKVERVREEVAKVIVGQDDVIEKLLMCVFAGGHCLMMGVPGLAKTLIIRTLADVLDLGFKRIQFTPDLMPGDITGSEVIEEQPDGTKKFVFVRGPLFSNMILADEINRTPPRTQAALLEAMQEHMVTIGNTTYPLDEPFAWALVRLDGADTTILHALDGGSPDKVQQGMRVRIRWRDETKGHITDIECFEPEEG